METAATMMRVVSTPEESDLLRREWEAERNGQTVEHPIRIALVPTMGALHDGHGALCRLAKRSADRVIVSIFVNPLQFGPSEDLERYPRPRDEDLRLCREWGVDGVFYPSVDILYPEGVGADKTLVVPPAFLTERLCGADRPGHFTGVATVVLKLFNLLRPHCAVFGEKDAQQLAIIRRLAQDLHVPVEIISHPTVREADGLALSSRNRYLATNEHRQAALSLFRILNAARMAVSASPSPLPARSVLDTIANQTLLSLASGPSVDIQYLEAVDAETFASSDTLHPGVKVLIAARVGDVRLIDNMDMNAG